MQNLTRLAAASAGIHTADQIAVAAVPLIAAVAFHASPETIGILVACQSLAHLLGSVPSGLIVDRIPARQVATAAALISATGFAVAAFSVATVQIASFGAAVTLAGFGIVLFVLASLSIIPLIVEVSGIPAANSKVEMARALPFFAAPLCVGLLAGQGPAAFLMMLALLASITSFAAASGLPRLEIQPPKKAP
ncbi:MAG TPA: MFS transporter, partial [Afifellaceae bacterium]|nr:MFS transporter [Afifellaceae bacterium]